MFGNLKLPVPPELPARSPPPESNEPIVIWGAGGSTGQYAIQVLNFAGYTNVIAIASSRHHEYLKGLGARITIDYRAEDICEQVLRASGGPVKYVLDAVGDEKYTLEPISNFVAAGSQVAYLLPVRVGEMGAVQQVKWRTDTVFPEGVELFGVKTALYHVEVSLPCILDTSHGSSAVWPTWV